MDFSSSLTDAQIPLVIDASVLISLHACTYGERIISAIPNKIVVPEIVSVEFERGTAEKLFLRNLIKTGVIELHKLTDDEYELFGNLISDLGDGESATIAMAISRNFLPVIDERKGRAEARLQAAALIPAWSLDLLRHPAVITTLGVATATEAVYLALRESHMRIPVERAEEVIALIGHDQAKECTCLPGYKRRFLSLPGKV